MQTIFSTLVLELSTLPSGASIVDWLKSWPLSVVIAWAVLILLVIFRAWPAKLVAKLLVAKKKRTHLQDADVAKTTLVPGIGWLLVGLAIFVVWELTPSPPHFDTFLDKIASSVLIAGFFFFLYTFSELTWFWLKPDQDDDLATKRNARHYLSASLRIVVLIIGILSVMSVWIRNISGVIAGLGISGLAVALAAQETLANFIGSLAIMFDHPFVLGDYIFTPDLEGTVIRVGLRSSQLRQPDQTVVYIPNKKLSESVIANQSQRTERRVDTMLYIALKNDPSDIAVFLPALAEAINSDENVVIKDETLVDIQSFTERSISIRMRYFTVFDFDAMLQTSGRINQQALQLAKAHNLNLAAYPILDPSMPASLDK